MDIYSIVYIMIYKYTIYRYTYILYIYRHIVFNNILNKVGISFVIFQFITFGHDNLLVNAIICLLHNKLYNNIL